MLTLSTAADLTRQSSAIPLFIVEDNWYSSAKDAEGPVLPVTGHLLLILFDTFLQHQNIASTILQDGYDL